MNNAANTTFVSRHTCSPFNFNSGFFSVISEVLCRILAKSSFTQFSTIHRVGHCLWESSLNAGCLGFGVNIRLPGVTLTSVSPEGGVNIRFPRVGDVNISPGWVSSTSDQSQEWRSSTSESQRWVSPTADSPVWVSPKSDSLGWVSSTLDFLGWVSSTSVTCSRAASVSYPSVSSS